MNIQDVAVDAFDELRTCVECGTIHPGEIQAEWPQTDSYYAAEIRYECGYCGHTNTPRVTIKLEGEHAVVLDE